MVHARAAVLCGLLFVQLSCSTPPAPTVDPALATGPHVWTTSDGQALPYAVSGAGDATVVLVHCWMCEGSFWDTQVPVLAERYRTITLDLPGHGRAGTTRPTWTVERYGDDVAGLLAALDLSNVVLVGHSMGGPVALRAAALAKPRVRGIVAVDTLHDAEFDYSRPEIEAFFRAFEADYSGTCSGFVDSMFPETGVEAIRDRVRTIGCDPSRAEIGRSLMRSFATVDMPAWFRAAGVPIRAINAAGSNPTRIDTNRKYADFDAVLIDGVGHYPHMTRPSEFNPILLAKIAEVLGGAA